MTMKYICPLLFVEDMNIARRFYIINTETYSSTAPRDAEPTYFT